MTETVRVERDGAIVTVILDRPEVRNAVDRPTAEALCEAFRTFDADDSAPSRCYGAPAARSAPAPI